MRIRIISGYLGGRFITTPPGNDTHPMSQRARGALFNSLGDVTGVQLLDPFAGSGAISIEAISRGAASAVAIEKSKPAQFVIRQNIVSLGLEADIQLVCATCLQWHQINPEKMFDLIICDPPYHHMQLKTIELLASHLLPKGQLVLSHSSEDKAPMLQGLQLVKTGNRKYSGAALAYYRLAQ